MGSFDPSETSEQIRLAGWLDRHVVDWEHIPNEGRRSGREGRILNMMGRKAGTADIHISAKVPRFPACRGVRIELKKRGGKATPLQMRRLERLQEKCGYMTRVCFGADDAIRWLMELGFGTSKGAEVTGKGNESKTRGSSQVTGDGSGTKKLGSSQVTGSIPKPMSGSNSLGPKLQF